jgi:hypothetical protein
MSLADYKVEIDSVAELNGPEPGDLLMCTLGLPCDVTVNGYGLDSTTNKIVAITDGNCGDANPTVNTEFAERPQWSAASASPSLSTESTSYTFGTPVAGYPYANYKLCWGHDPADGDYSGYNIEIDAAGDLFGPDRMELACTMGLPCVLTVTGYGLTTDNQLAAAEGSCGASASVSTQTWDAIGPASVSTDGAEAVFNFGTPVVGTPGDFYVLCWGNAGALSELVVPLDDVGELVGPELNDFLCTMGLPCSLDITGYNLGLSSSLVVLESGSCGDLTPSLRCGPAPYPRWYPLVGMASVMGTVTV